MLSLASKFYIISGFCWVQTINKPFQHNQRKQQQKRSIREQNQRGRKKKQREKKVPDGYLKLTTQIRKNVGLGVSSRKIWFCYYGRETVWELSLSLSLKWQVFVCVSVRGKKKSSRWEARRKSRELYGSISLKLEKPSFFEFQTVGDLESLPVF